MTPVTGALVKPVSHAAGIARSIAPGMNGVGSGPKVHSCCGSGAPGSRNPAGLVSRTLTVNVELVVLPALSDAEQVTVVLPNGNVESDGGAHVSVDPSLAATSYVIAVPLASKASATSVAGSANCADGLAGDPLPYFAEAEPFEPPVTIVVTGFEMLFERSKSNVLLTSPTVATLTRFAAA